MQCRELQPQERSEKLVRELVEVWEGSVRATHLFLQPSDIENIKQYVPMALKEVPRLMVAFGENEAPLGFIGLSEHKIEMLFISSDCRGKGIGKQLLLQADARWQINEVVVNEQNPQAKGFYEHMGFSVYACSETDEQGGPFPILFMKK